MSGNGSYRKTEYEIRKAVRFAKEHPVMAALLAVLIVLVLIFGSQGENDTIAPMEHGEGLYLHSIDVGQGDCELLECNGEYMLIDAGKPESGKVVVGYLEKLGVTRLEYVVCSHGDSDHCGGLDDVVESFEVGTVFISPYDNNKPAFEIFMEAVQNAGLEAECPDMGISYPLGGAMVKFIGPTEDNGEINENSLILRVEYGSTAFLLTGDVQRLGEETLLDSGADLKCDVLKVAHHGSRSSTSYHFLYEASPEIAVISCGKDNSYGHPHDEVLSRLSDANVTVYRTDIEGTIIIYSNGEKVGRVSA